MGLYVAFHCARLVFSIAKFRINGTMVVIWHQGRVLLVKSSYRKCWSVPGGLVNRGETWLQAAVRETHEEVGIHLNADDLVFKAEVPGDLGPRDISHLFEITVDHLPEVAADGREILHAEFVKPETALQRPLHRNVKTYLLARLNG